ncbi:hypothetical protein JW865_09310 [Candidatus Bathyarchaeota archaeon]|nr:hypothetical protein [Candidatus Bathyarchaeota archaeon]
MIGNLTSDQFALMVFFAIILILPALYKYAPKKEAPPLGSRPGLKKPVDTGIECPNCKSSNVKLEILNVGALYDCTCKECGERFTTPIKGYLNFKEFRYSAYVEPFETKQERKWALQISDVVHRELLPAVLALCFTVLSLIATVSMNSYLAYPFGGVAFIFWVWYLVRKILGKKNQEKMWER